MDRCLSIHGTLAWVPPQDNGPTMPFENEHITSFAYVGDDRGHQSALVVRGLLPGTDECGVEARWVDGYPELALAPGDVITLTASQRPIAVITVSRVELSESAIWSN